MVVKVGKGVELRIGFTRYDHDLCPVAPIPYRLEKRRDKLTASRRSSLAAAQHIRPLKQKRALGLQRINLSREPPGLGLWQVVAADADDGLVRLLRLLMGEAEIGGADGALVPGKAGVVVQRRHLFVGD
jgi:hypothetical protein